MATATEIRTQEKQRERAQNRLRQQKKQTLQYERDMKLREINKQCSDSITAINEDRKRKHAKIWQEYRKALSGDSD